MQSLFDLPTYFKFFIGLFALVNPVGIIPVFISMTSYQTAAARNKTNLTANHRYSSVMAFCNCSESRLIRSVLRAAFWW